MTSWRWSRGCAQLVSAKNPADVAALSALPMAKARSIDPFRTGRQDRRKHVAAPLCARRGRGKLVSYIHGGAKIGVLLDLVGGDEQLGKDIAMHIAASKPKSLDASGVPGPDRYRASVAIEKARADNKPESMLEKIADGTVQKFLKEVTLLAQVFVKAEDGKQTVEQLLKAKGHRSPASRCTSSAKASRRR